ncbi:hypothetical protein AZI86_17300 [Bdellovibrio bacteriovorus]|uniref:Lipoprotein n=1 Tax=Bdellovibrio bacteriovorus TaxID=959 RepID=A0A150WEL6_BDEBC|nr:hypothetical protein [Bdellovibrio bacteriovorus]KYG61469.1 hypothetical protein AZI86_17300 [Bdellovibrio bacteriovorus]
MRTIFILLLSLFSFAACGPRERNQEGPKSAPPLTYRTQGYSGLVAVKTLETDPYVLNIEIERSHEDINHILRLQYFEALEDSLVPGEETVTFGCGGHEPKSPLPTEITADTIVLCGELVFPKVINFKANNIIFESATVTIQNEEEEKITTAYLKSKNPITLNGDARIIMEGRVRSDEKGRGTTPTFYLTVPRFEGLGRMHIISKAYYILNK